MSYQDGWAAVCLEKPDRVPHTEYSVESHWEVVKRVTGIEAGPFSGAEQKKSAANALWKAWNIDFLWNTRTSSDVFGQTFTNMGHAVYQEGGVDYDDDIHSPFQSAEDVLAFDPERFYQAPPHGELVRMYEQDYAAHVNTYPDAVNMTGIYVSCMSGLIAMFGWDLLLEALGEDPEGFGRVTESYGRFIRRYFHALADADVPIVMIHDDLVWTAGPFASPAWYRQYIFPTLQKNIAPLVESGKKIAFTSDGNYNEFIDDIAGLGVHGFILEPMTDLRAIAEKYGKTHFFIGNADTRILLTGTKDDISAEVKRCMDIGKPYPGFFMAVGNHIPPNTPTDSVLWYEECYEKMAKR